MGKVHGSLARAGKVKSQVSRRVGGKDGRRAGKGWHRTVMGRLRHGDYDTTTTMRTRTARARGGQRETQERETTRIRGRTPGREIADSTTRAPCQRHTDNDGKHLFSSPPHHSPIRPRTIAPLCLPARRPSAAYYFQNPTNPATRLPRSRSRRRRRPPRAVPVSSTHARRLVPARVDAVAASSHTRTHV